MIKFDRDVHLALKALEKNGYETYAIGNCIKDSLRGLQPYDWDMVTTANAAQIMEVLPKGQLIDPENEVVRVDFTYEVAGADEDEPSHIEGSVVDIRTMTGTILEEVDKYGFSIEAMADNPERTFIDPYSGNDDLKKKLIRTTKDADTMFKENPILMMSAVSLAAEMGFDLHKSVYEAILANWRILLDVDKYGTQIREELERLLVADFAGKGLNLMAGSGLMAVVLGEEVSKKMSAGEMTQFTGLCENIDKTKPLRMRRLGLLYTCLSKKKGLEAIGRLDFDPKTKLHLEDAMNEIINIQFLVNDKAFKRYLFEHGMERYNYLHNLNKAQRIVYDHPATKIEARNYMMREIETKRQPVFVEDLEIDANDILEAGITDSPERAEELLTMVIATVHDDARNNKREYLLKMAKKYHKSKFSSKTRYIKWMR